VQLSQLVFAVAAIGRPAAHNQYVPIATQRRFLYKVRVFRWTALRFGGVHDRVGADVTNAKRGQRG
jgi:hypothetical protein